MSDVFGAALRMARTRKNMTQRDLAERLGVDHTYISKIEHGSMPVPSGALVFLMASILEEDGLVMLAGKVPPGLKKMLEGNPHFCELIYELSHKRLPDELYQVLTAVVMDNNSL